MRYKPGWQGHKKPDREIKRWFSRCAFGRNLREGIAWSRDKLSSSRQGLDVCYCTGGDTDTQVGCQIKKQTHTGLIKNDELIYICECVCAGEGVSVFAVGGWDGQGREGRVCRLVSFFHLKIRASPENKGKLN